MFAMWELDWLFFSDNYKRYKKVVQISSMYSQFYNMNLSNVSITQFIKLHLSHNRLPYRAYKLDQNISTL